MPAKLRSIERVDVKLMNIFTIIVIATISTYVIPIVCALQRLSRLTTGMAVFLGLLIFTVCTELYSLYALILKSNPFWIQHLYTPVEYAAVGFIFSRWFDNKYLSRAILISIPIFWIICVISVYTFEDLTRTNGFTAMLACSVFLVSAGYSMISLIKKDIGDIHKNNRFWIIGGLFIYSSTSLLYFAFSDFITTYYPWLIHNICNVTVNIMYGVGFLCLKHR
jgi:hypothetical protein